MTGPDGSYRQTPGQPPDAGRQVQHPGQGQYPDQGRYPGAGSSSPTGNQYTPGGQYPAAGQFSGGDKYPTGGQYPAAGQPYAAAGQYPAGGQQYPAAGQQFPAGGQQYPAGGQYPGAAAAQGQSYAAAGGWEPTPAVQDPGASRPLDVGRRAGIDPAKLLGLAVAALGGLNFVFGFLPEVSAPRSGESLSVFAVGPAYVPILLLIAGLLALAAFLPGSERSRLAVAAVSVGGAVGAIVSLGTPGSFELFANPGQVSSGLGAILLVIFGIIQAVIAVAAYVVGADTQWTRKKGAGRPGAASSGSRSWDSGASAPGGPVDANLVGVVPAPPAATGGSYQPAAAWPADPRAAQPDWYSAGSAPGYSQPAAYGPRAEPAPPASTTSVLPPRARHEEPITGPQVVVGMETVRVDVTKSPAESPPSPGAGGGDPQSGPEVPAGEVVDPAAEPADRELGGRSAEPSATGGRPAEQDPPGRQGF